MTATTRLADPATTAAPSGTAVPAGSADVVDPIAAAPSKPLRADARRNRDTLVRTATDAFSQDGVEVPLEEIARRAGVGIGTLYRHFRTREELVLAVYTQQIDDLQEAARTLPEKLGPSEALREWMRGFVRYGAVKRGLIALLKTMMQDDSSLFDRSREVLRESAQGLLDRAAEAGEIRADVHAPEVIRGISGICMATDRPDNVDVALSLVDLVFDGLRYGAPKPAAATVTP